MQAGYPGPSVKQQGKGTVHPIPSDGCPATAEGRMCLRLSRSLSHLQHNIMSAKCLASPLQYKMRMPKESRGTSRGQWWREKNSWK